MDKYKNIPAELRQLPQWVVRKGKKPIDPRSGSMAKAGQPATWGTFGQAASAPGYDGIGFEFAESGGIVGVDLDTVRDPKTGYIAPEAVDIINTLESYTEISPSGYGFHIFLRADLKLPWSKAPLPDNGIERYEADPKTGKRRRKAPELEVYNEKRYFTVTGEVYGEHADLAERTAELMAVMACYGKKKAAPALPPPLPTDSQDWLKRGLEKDKKLRALWDGERPSGDESRDDLSLMNKLAYWCNRDTGAMIAAFLSSPYVSFKDEEHQKKAQRKDYLQRTAEQAAQDCQKTAIEDHEKFREERVHKDFGGTSKPVQDWTPISLEDLKHYSLNDIGAARLFAHFYRHELLYLPEYKTYWCYSGGRWKQDKGSHIAKNRAKSLMEYIVKLIPPAPKPKEGEVWDPVADAEKFQDDWKPYRDHYYKYGALRYRKTQVEDAQDELVAEASEFDTQPLYFNCRNGTLDLSSFTLRPHRASDKLSKKANVFYDPAARCERFEAFIKEICDGDAERAHMLQKVLGYSLKGSANEECCFIALGEKTRNGKGTLFDTILNIFGGYGAQMDFNTIARSGAKDGSRATPDLARLIGVRFVLANEPEKGVCFNEALLKQLTGGDDITARPLYSDVIEFKPVFKLFITTNSRPTVADDSLFTSDRLKILPFTRHFDADSRDTHLKEGFRDEQAKSGILNWLIEGYRMYLAEGLKDTSEMKKLVEEYRSDNDYIGQYLAERYLPDTKGTVTVKALRYDYKTWCEIIGTVPLGVKAFKEDLLKRDFRITQAHGQATIHGAIRPTNYLSE